MVDIGFYMRENPFCPSIPFQCSLSSHRTRFIYRFHCNIVKDKEGDSIQKPKRASDQPMDRFPVYSFYINKLLGRGAWLVINRYTCHALKRVCHRREGTKNFVKLLKYHLFSLLNGVLIIGRC